MQDETRNFIFEQAEASVSTGIACILGRIIHLNSWVLSPPDLMDAWLLWLKNRAYTEAQNHTMLAAAYERRFGTQAFSNRAGESLRYADAARVVNTYLVPALTIGQVKDI
jgi:hypothetical protein